MKYKIISFATGLLFGIAGFAQSTTITEEFGYFDVTFYNIGDSNGYVTGESNWTAEQRTDVGAALLAWNRILNTPGRNVQVDMFWGELDAFGTNVLGGSSSVRVSDGSTIWNAGEYVWKEETDIDTPLDTMIQFDITAANTSWNFGASVAGTGEIDFRSVTSHEIGHSLGWSSSYDYVYDDFGWFDDTFGYMGLTAWDENLVDENGNRPESGTSGGAPFDFNETGTVYFDGLNASAVNGGPVPIYSPNAFAPGSSLSHLDENTFTNFLMSPSISLGETIREVSELEWAMMADMGWDIKPIPEPATAFLFGAGLVGLVGIRLRKRKK